MRVSQLADGVDDETWIYHLRQHDYSKWFTSMIKDPELGRQASEIEQQHDFPAGRAPENAGDH
jgi:hypothetical protein